MKNFWDNKIESEFNIRKFEDKKGMSDWKLLNLIYIKYDIEIKLRGIGAYEGAIRLIKNKEIFDKLNEKEKEFVTNLMS